MRCVLGVDSGGTKCDAVLVRDDGEVLGWGRCEFIDPDSGRSRGGSGRSMQTISRAVTQAINHHIIDELHIASVNRYFPGEFWNDEQIGKVELHGVTEFRPALALVGEEYGAVALAGTGAFVYGKTRDGRSRYLDGLGPMLGDFGGGYFIGKLAVRAAVKARWHPRHATSLENIVFEALGLDDGTRSRRDIVSYMHSDRDRAEIASLARLVNDEAEAGDRIAREILKQAAAALSETFFDVVDHLGMRDEEYAMVGTGSVIKYSRLYWEYFCALVHEIAPLFRPLKSDLPPVAGIALLGLEKITGDAFPPIRDTFLASVRATMHELNRTSCLLAPPPAQEVEQIRDWSRPLKERISSAPPEYSAQFAPTKENPV